MPPQSKVQPSACPRSGPFPKGVCNCRCFVCRRLVQCRRVRLDRGENRSGPEPFTERIVMFGLIGFVGLLFGVVFFCLAVLSTLFWIWILVDCAMKVTSQGNETLGWILIILFTHRICGRL